MTRYDADFKLQLVERYLSSKDSGFKRLSKEYGIAPGTLQRWVASYQQHGAEGVNKKSTQYSAEFKLSVLQCMWEEELSYRQVAAQFNIRGGSILGMWERQYHEGGLDALRPKPRGRPKKMTMPESPTPAPAPQTDTRTLEDLRKENEYLRAEVAYLKKLDALVRAKQQAAQKKHKPSSN